MEIQCDQDISRHFQKPPAFFFNRGFILKEENKPIADLFFETAQSVLETCYRLKSPDLPGIDQLPDHRQRINTFAPAMLISQTNDRFFKDKIQEAGLFMEQAGCLFLIQHQSVPGNRIPPRGYEMKNLCLVCLFRGGAFRVQKRRIPARYLHNRSVKIEFFPVIVQNRLYNRIDKTL